MNGGVSLAKKVYAVRVGRSTGLFRAWESCQKQVKGYPGARYKSFATEREANAWLQAESTATEVPQQMQDHVAYIDGSFDKYTHQYAFGVVLIYEGKEEHFSRSFQDPERAKLHNVAGELEGAIFAMNAAKERGWPRIDIYYDYQGIECWATGEWKRNLQVTQDYHTFCRSIMENLDVHFHKVKGHSGVLYNEMADKLARAALNKS